MKIPKQLEKFANVNTLIVLLGIFVLFMAMRQFSKNKVVIANEETPVTDSTPLQGASESHTPQFMEIGGPSDASMLLPTGATANVGPNMLAAGASIGMVSQCSKNPNMQIRAEPPNPRGTGPQTESVIEQPPPSGLPDIRH